MTKNNPNNNLSGIFLPYQSALMEAVINHPVVVVEKSRRTGYSWAASFIASLVAGSSRQAGGMDVFYMGYNQDMTRGFINDCSEHLPMMQIVAEQARESFFKDPENPEKDIKVFRIDCASGHEILALPSVARALRSKQGLVILDEAAFYDDLDEVLKAAFALLMWGGKVVIISTHNGDTNPFNVLVQDVRADRSPYQLLRCTFDDALSQGLYRKICEKEDHVWSLEAQQQWRNQIMAFYGHAADEELFCIPSASTGAYIPLPLIEARQQEAIPVIRWAQNDGFALMADHLRQMDTEQFCLTDLKPLLTQLDAETPYVFGEDFGRSGDLTVIWVAGIGRDMTRQTAFVVELRNIPFEQQKQVLFYILDGLPIFRAGFMDGRGNGQYLAEVTVQKYGARVTPVMLSENWYRENMPPLKAAFEDGTLTVPKDRDIMDDIRALTLVRGVARIPDNRTKDKSGQRHGDAAIALAMAYAASRTEIEEYGYEPVNHPIKAMDVPSYSGSIEEELAMEEAGEHNIYGLHGRVV